MVILELVDRKIEEKTRRVKEKAEESDRAAPRKVTEVAETKTDKRSEDSSEQATVSRAEEKALDREAEEPPEADVADASASAGEKTESKE